MSLCGARSCRMGEVLLDVLIGFVVSLFVFLLVVGVREAWREWKDLGSRHDSDLKG